MTHSSQTGSPSNPTLDGYGTLRWYPDEKLHRIDGPAIEDADGTRGWYVNGNPHMVDGPAIECADGTKEWWSNGWPISTPYSHVLTVAFALGLPIAPDVLPEIYKAMFETLGSQKAELDKLNSILNKYWPADVHKILARILSGHDMTIKPLAFALLKREPPPKSESISLIV